MFFTFSKGDNFYDYLFAFPYTALSSGAKPFTSEETHIDTGNKKHNERVATLEGVFISLSCMLLSHGCFSLFQAGAKGVNTGCKGRGGKS